MVFKNQNGVDFAFESNYAVTYEQLNTLITFLKLWTQLSMWLRSVLVSTVGNLDNKEAVVYELFNVPNNFYNVFKVFYGPLISQQFQNLLTSFITRAWNLIEALKDGNNELVNKSTSQLYQTADELASFLSQINVYWDERQWKNLLYQFIKLFIDEIIAMLSGNYEQEIQIYNRLDDVTDIMGSYMARGIIARSIDSRGESS